MKTEQIRTQLTHLNNSLTEIEDSAVILADGFVVASQIVHNIDEERIGTVSAALFGLANTAAKEFEKDEVQYVLIKCKRNYIAMFKAGKNAELFVDFKDTPNLDTIIKKCLVASDTLAQLVES